MIAVSKNEKSTESKYLYWIQLVVFLFPIIIYSNTIGHDYALDDAMVITHNRFTQNGIEGIKDIFTNDSFTGFYKESQTILSGGRYRPLSIATFAFENEMWGNNPHLSHLINIILYALTGLLLFNVLKLILEDKFDKPSRLLNISLIATLIFLAHPVHSEVVANIKGRDEIFSFLFSLIALLSAIYFLAKKHWLWLLVCSISLFFGLLSKENAVAFVLLIPLSLFFFRRASLNDLLTVSIPLVIAVVSYFIVRNAVVGDFQVGNSADLMNNPFANATVAQKYSTILYTLVIYLKLLFWPHPLTFDYYPYHIPLVSWGNVWVIFSLLVYMFLLIYALTRLKYKGLLSYSILFYLIALFPVSNLVINLGTFMNERFLYQASTGFSLFVAWMLVYFSKSSLVKKLQSGFIIRLLVVFVVIFSFSIVTYSRNGVWKNNYTLFTTDVLTSANSAKCNYAAGKILLDSALVETNELKKNKDLEKSIQYLSKSISIDPGYSDVWINLGTAQYEFNHDVLKSFQYYYNGLKNSPGDEKLYSNIHFILSRLNNPDKKIDLYNTLLNLNQRRADVYAQIGLIYGKEKKEIETAIGYFNKSLAIDPSYKDAYRGLGIAYMVSKNYEEALFNFEKCLKNDGSDASVYKLMASVCRSMGDTERAQVYLSKISISDKLVP